MGSSAGEKDMEPADAERPGCREGLEEPVHLWKKSEPPASIHVQVRGLPQNRMAFRQAGKRARAGMNLSYNAPNHLKTAGRFILN